MTNERVYEVKIEKNSVGRRNMNYEHATNECIFQSAMVGGQNAPAYYVTVKKDKRLKGFYWMVNTSTSYSLLQTILTTNGMNMSADKAPAVEYTPEIKAFLEITVASYRTELPGLVHPLRAIEMVDVLRDLADRDLVRMDTLGEGLRAQIEEGSSITPKRSARIGNKIKKASEKWVLDNGPSQSSQGSNKRDLSAIDDPMEGASQMMDKFQRIFQNSPRNGKTAEDEDKSDQEIEEEGGEDEGDNEGQRHVEEAVDGVVPNAKRVRRGDTKCEGMSHQNMETMVKRLEKIGEKNTERIVQESSSNLEHAIDRVYEQTKNGTREIKKALANCYNEIEQGGQRAETAEHNMRELIKAQGVTNKLLEQLSRRMDALEKDRTEIVEVPFKAAFKKYCTFCKVGSHDFEECNEKIMCFRCGEYNHKEEVCYWRERSCGRCNNRGHKRDMHDTTDTEAREMLIMTFPRSFSHFLVDSQATGSRPSRDGYKGKGGANGKPIPKNRGSEGRRYNN